MGFSSLERSRNVRGEHIRTEETAAEADQGVPVERCTGRPPHATSLASGALVGGLPGLRERVEPGNRVAAEWRELEPWRRVRTIESR
jgi:hypothetical protein